MRFRIYILLAAALLWFTFASVFMYRSSWNKKENALYHKDILVEFGLKDRFRSGNSSILFFKLHGLEPTMGIFKKKFKDYDTLMNSLKIGDTLTLYYENWKQAKGEINPQVVHLENKTSVLVDYSKRKRRDLTVALILYTICSGFLIAAWLLNQKRLRSLRNRGLEFYGLGAY